MVFWLNRNKIENPGFTMIEMLIILSITALLTTIVMVNFSQLRTSHQVQAAANDMISKIREVQNFVLTGKEQESSGSPKNTPRAYSIFFGNEAPWFVILYHTGSATDTLETVTLPQNTKIKDVFQAGVRQAVFLRMESPYATFSVNGNPTAKLRIDVSDTTGQTVRSLEIDPVSGRIGAR